MSGRGGGFCAVPLQADAMGRPSPAFAPGPGRAWRRGFGYAPGNRVPHCRHNQDRPGPGWASGYLANRRWAGFTRARDLDRSELEDYAAALKQELAAVEEEIAQTGRDPSGLDKRADAGGVVHGRNPLANAPLAIHGPDAAAESQNGEARR